MIGSKLGGQKDLVSKPQTHVLQVRIALCLSQTVKLFYISKKDLVSKTQTVLQVRIVLCLSQTVK